MLSTLQLRKGRPTLARSPTPSSLILEPVLLVVELMSSAQTGAQHNSSAGADITVNLSDGAAVVRTRIPGMDLLFLLHKTGRTTKLRHRRGVRDVKESVSAARS